MSSKILPVYHLGLIGYPLGHSLSPQLHNAALAAAGLVGDYALFPIPPSDSGLLEMTALAKQLRKNNLQGLNVTIPHKQNIRNLVDEQSDVAQAVGAVNTLYREIDGRLIGDNTDVPGFLRDVRRMVSSRGGGRALVLGAGGSARAVVYGLAQSGWQVRVLARREIQAAELVREIAKVLPEFCGLSSGIFSSDELVDFNGCDLLVNTTPLGMFPHSEGCPWPDGVPLPEQSAVYDLVYNPLETVLLRRARAEGLPAASGAGMLIAQAALAFQRWTGIEAPFAVMERAFYKSQTMQTGVE